MPRCYQSNFDRRFGWIGVEDSADLTGGGEGGFLVGVPGIDSVPIAKYVPFGTRPSSVGTTVSRAQSTAIGARGINCLPTVGTGPTVTRTPEASTTTVRGAWVFTAGLG
jgi:hypothetical protein